MPDHFGVAHAVAVVTDAGVGSTQAIAGVRGAGASVAESSARSTEVVKQADVVLRADPTLALVGLVAVAGSRQSYNANASFGQGVVSLVKAQPQLVGFELSNNPNVAALDSGTHNAIARGFVRGAPYVSDDAWTSTTTLSIDRSQLLSEPMDFGFLDPTVPALGGARRP